MGIWIEEFLYRGRDPDGDLAPGWHVILASSVTDGFGQQTTSVKGPMTPDDAAALGYSLPDILTDINTSTLSTVDGLNAQIADLTTQLNDAKSSLDSVTAQFDALTAQYATAMTALGKAGTERDQATNKLIEVQAEYQDYKESAEAQIGVMTATIQRLSSQ